MIEQARSAIDKIDSQLVDLFCQRMHQAAAIAAYKQAHSLPIAQPERERQILGRIAEQAGPELEDYAVSLFRLMFDLSRSYQSRLSLPEGRLSARIQQALLPASALFPAKGVVACQGCEGSYSQTAAQRLFSLPSLMFFHSFENVFQAVESGLCQFGVLPIENSSYGSVGTVYDLMRQHNFHIVRGVRLSISHCLLGKAGASLGKIKRIYSHEQALGQCSEFLSSLPGVEIHAVANTAEAAQLVAAANSEDAAAIAAPDCAAIYGLSVLHDQVQNSANNHTRFICIAKDLAIYPGANRISLMFSLPHCPGSLYRVLARFAALGLNLTKLESRPIKNKDFEFMFYVDFEASLWSENILRLLDELDSSYEGLTFLGCYSEV